MQQKDVIIALPSKGALAQPATTFLKDCGLSVWKPNPRQYTGTISTLPNTNVMFQRVKDIVYKVADGTAHLGITGLDVVAEYADENVMVIHDNLGFGHCQLLVAVPEAWVDVENMLDLADIALDIRENQHRNLRIATTYTRSARKFLHECGIHHFTLVKADGAIEAAPTLGYADAVVDLTQTGTTLRENRLKPLEDGIIITSQACLIGNKNALKNNASVMQTLQTMLEQIDASLYGQQFYQLTANIAGDSAERIGQMLSENTATSGLKGASIATIPVFNAQKPNWFTITITIEKSNMLKAVEYIRSIGGSQTVVQPVKFVFMEKSPSFAALQQKMASLD